MGHWESSLQPFLHGSGVGSTLLGLKLGFNPILLFPWLSWKWNERKVGRGKKEGGEERKEKRKLKERRNLNYLKIKG